MSTGSQLLTTYKASELTSNAGSTTLPVYFSGGKPAAINTTGVGISITGNAATASTWATARNFTIGATAKSVNGSAAVTWTDNEIGFFDLATAGIMLESGTDIDTMTAYGNFYVSNSTNMANLAGTLPWTGAGGRIINMHGYSTNCDRQFGFSSNQYIHTRHKSSGTWQAWKTLAFTDGTGATGTWGIDITGHATKDLALTGGTMTGSIITTNSSPILYTYAASTEGPMLVLKNAVNYGIRYQEGTPDTLKLSASGNANTNNADLCINGAGNGTVTIRGNTILHAGNYNSYAPTKTGGGASGTWNININGIAAHASGPGVSTSWCNGRDGAIVKTTSINGYSGTMSVKTTNGAWTVGAYNHSNFTDKLIFSYVTDANYNSSTNSANIYTIDTNGVFSGSCSGSSGSCTGNSATATNADKLDDWHRDDVRRGGLQFTRAVNNSNPSNLNNLGEGMAYNYSSTSYWQNAPSGASYGGAIAFNSSGSNTSVALAGQFFWDVNHNSTASTKSLWFRAGNNLGWQADWKQIVFNSGTWGISISGNAATATTSSKITIADGTGPTKYNVIGVPSYAAGAQAVYVSSSVTINNVGVFGAVWNDYAEYRQATTEEPGYVVYENGDDTLSPTQFRMQHFAGVTSDTFGFAEGETDTAKTPIAVAGRVLVYPYHPRDWYQPGDCVCAAPDGTVDIMTRDEVALYPDRIVGTVSCVPDYDTWGTGNVPVNGRIWIKVK